ncbi:MAG: hypothetical protein U5L09_03305 [Bacteroidales bacterium]|nr:hypothetical protein [Bacteroidales bacterium]
MPENKLWLQKRRHAIIRVTFKLTTRQRQSLEAYCRNNDTTPR